MVPKAMVETATTAAKVEQTVNLRPAQALVANTAVDNNYQNSESSTPAAALAPSGSAVPDLEDLHAHCEDKSWNNYENTVLL